MIESPLRYLQYPVRKMRGVPYLMTFISSYFIRRRRVAYLTSEAIYFATTFLSPSPGRASSFNAAPPITSPLIERETFVSERRHSRHKFISAAAVKGLNHIWLGRFDSLVGWSLRLV